MLNSINFIFIGDVDISESFTWYAPALSYIINKCIQISRYKNIYILISAINQIIYELLMRADNCYQTLLHNFRC